MATKNALLIEVVPDDPEKDPNEIFEKIKEILPSDVEVKDYKIEPFVYGLKKIKLLLVIPEVEGKSDEIQKTIETIPGVSAEIISLTRL